MLKCNHYTTATRTRLYLFLVFFEFLQSQIDRPPSYSLDPQLLTFLKLEMETVSPDVFFRVSMLHYSTCCDLNTPLDILFLNFEVSEAKYIFIFRSRRPEVFCKKGVLKIFAKFTGKHMCGACNFIKKETLTQVFSCEFCEISKHTFFTEHRWLLLYFVSSDCIVTFSCNLRLLKELGGKY